LNISLEQFHEFAGDDLEKWQFLVGKATVRHKKYLYGTIDEITAYPDGSLDIWILFQNTIEGKNRRRFTKQTFNSSFFEFLTINSAEFEHSLEKHYCLVQYIKEQQEKEKQRAWEREIAELLSDFRAGEVDQITPDDVARWADQFPYDRDEDRSVLLAEMRHLLRRFYYSKERAKQDIQYFIDQLQHYCKDQRWDPIDGIRRLNFIDQQQKYGYSRIYIYARLAKRSSRRTV